MLSIQPRPPHALQLVPLRPSLWYLYIHSQNAFGPFRAQNLLNRAIGPLPLFLRHAKEVDVLQLTNLCVVTSGMGYQATPTISAVVTWRDS